MPAGFFQEFPRNSPRTWNTNAGKDTEFWVGYPSQVKADKKKSEWCCSSLRGPQHDHSSNIFRSQLPSPPENRSSNQHGTRTAKPRLGFKRRRAMAEGPSFSDGENLKIDASGQVCDCVFLEPCEDVSIQVTSWSMLRRCHRAWRVVAADQNRSPRLCRI